MGTITLNIPGQPPSKSNCNKTGTIGTGEWICPKCGATVEKDEKVCKAGVIKEGKVLPRICGGVRGKSSACNHCGLRPVRASFFPHDTVREYEQKFRDATLLQVPKRPMGYPCPGPKPWAGTPALTLHSKTWFSSWSPDCDGPAKILFDMLEASRIITNDSRVRRIIMDKDMCKDNPRTELRVSEWVDPDQPCLFPMELQDAIHMAREILPPQCWAPLEKKIVGEF